MEENFSAISSEFRKLLAHEVVDLARAALAIARIEYPDIDPELYLELTPRADDAEVARHLPMELHVINARFN